MTHATPPAPEIDTEGTDYPTCPGCGLECEDWWDGLPPKNDGDEWPSQCSRCGLDYTVQLFVSATFTTTPAV